MGQKPAAGGGEANDAGTVTDDSVDPRAAFYREQADAYIEQLEAEVAVIEEKITGWRATLAAKRDELRTAKADAKARS